MSRRRSDGNKSRSRSRSGSRSSRSSNSSHSDNSNSDDDAARVHVADLGLGVSKNELKRVFEKFGQLREVWIAKPPPSFAFIVFKYKREASEAIRATDGMTLCGSRIRVTVAHPRTRGKGRKGFDPNMRCYQCGGKGHFSRECAITRYGYRRPPSRSPPHERSSPSRHPSSRYRSSHRR